MPYADKEKEREYQKLYTIKRSVKKGKYDKEYYERNKKHHAEKTKLWYKNNKDKARLIAIRHRFDISEEQIQRYANTEFCEICGNRNGKRKLAVDHDHITGKVRGFLCRSCNHGLGNAKDNIGILMKMIKYLQERQ